MTPLALTTTRLLLRDFEADDWRGLHAWARDPAVTRPMGVEPFDVAASRGYVARMMAAQHMRPRRRWEVAIVCRADGRLVGACGLAVAHRRGTVGYVLARDRWGMGYGTEAAAALLAFGFEGLGLDRIDATCPRGHAASARVLGKVGLRRVPAGWWPLWSARRWWRFEVDVDGWRARRDAAPSPPVAAAGRSGG